MASICLKEDYRGKVTAEEVREYCRGHLAPYEVPSTIEFREEMPLTVSDKVFKKVLREQALEKIKRGQEGR